MFGTGCFIFDCTLYTCNIKLWPWGGTAQSLSYLSNFFLKWIRDQMSGQWQIFGFFGDCTACKMLQNSLLFIYLFYVQVFSLLYVHVSNLVEIQRLLMLNIYSITVCPGPLLLHYWIRMSKCRWVLLKWCFKVLFLWITKKHRYVD